MQSTGQTSTQALSLTLMHGSAIIYGIGIPLSDARPLRSDQMICTGLHASCQVFRILTAGYRASLGPQPGVERVAQRIAEQIEGEDGEADREPGEDRHPRRRLGELDGGAAEHQAPRRRRLRHAQAEELE